MKHTVTAYQKFIRQSPRKMRLVADMIRRLSVNEAFIQLELSDKTAAKSIIKVLNQAKSNAINNSQLKPETLKFKTVEIEEGPTLKRWQPVSRGRAHPILKRSSHIKIVLEGETNQ
jgi:large subunit ribosomal protein L22